MRLSIFFPAYYDEDNIGRVVSRAVEVLDNLPLEAYEITIIEDGSPDRTGQVADELAVQYPHVRVIHHQQNKGYGATLKEGFESARYEYVFYTDGDNQFDLRELPAFIKMTAEADIVIGYRRFKQYSPYRKFTSACYNLLIRGLFNLRVRDVNCAFKLIPTKLFREITVTSTHGFIDAEILLKARALGYTFVEQPVTHLPRKEGKAMGAKPAVILGTIRETWHYFISARNQR